MFSGMVQIAPIAPRLLPQICSPFAPNGTANKSPENPGPTVVSIGHLTPWPENPGYRTQVWDNTPYHMVITRTKLIVVGSYSFRV